MNLKGSKIKDDPILITFDPAGVEQDLSLHFLFIFDHFVVIEIFK